MNDIQEIIQVGKEEKMRRFLRKTVAFVLAGAVMMGMCTTGRAEDSSSDTQSFILTKDYQKGSSGQNSTSSPEEDFVFTIEPYGVWNAGSSTGAAGGEAYSVSNMPLLGTAVESKVTVDEQNRKTTVTIAAQAGDAEKAEERTNLSQAVSLPEYRSVGDFWYKVTETDNGVAGVLYGSNDSQTENRLKSNGGHQAVYFIHVQVMNGQTAGDYTRTVTLHKTAPDADATNTAYETWYQGNRENTEGEENKKTTAIQNQYYAGSLQITKSVTGNAGDKNKLFHIKVEFQNQSGDRMKSIITYKDFYDENGTVTANPTSIGWTDAGPDGRHTTTFYIKDGTTVSFDNIPYGVTYTITEEQPTDDKYTHTFAYDQDSADQETVWSSVTLRADTVSAEGSNEADQETATDAWNNAKASGSVTDDLDHVIITNHKESAIDIGVITSDAPYIAILILAAVMVVFYVRRKKEIIEE